MSGLNKDEQHLIDKIWQDGFLTALNDGYVSESSRYSGMELDIWNNGYSCGMKQKGINDNDNNRK